MASRVALSQAVGVYFSTDPANLTYSVRRAKAPSHSGCVWVVARHRTHVPTRAPSDGRLPFGAGTIQQYQSEFIPWQSDHYRGYAPIHNLPLE